MDIKHFFSNFGREDLTRETRLYFILAISFIIIALGALAFYLYYVLRSVAEPVEVEKTLVERQMEELNYLRKDAVPLTAEEINAQKESLDRLRRDASYSESDIKKQTEELESLR